MAAAENSVRADLEAAFKEHSDAASAAETTTTTTKSPEGESSSAAPPAERVRDESGRFVAKEQEDGQSKPNEKPAAKAEPAKAATPEASRVEPVRSVGASPQQNVGADSAANGKGAAAEVSAAPQGWSLGAKAKWTELPADIRAEITKRETDIHRGMTRMDEERQFARNMYQAVSPYEAAFRAEGVSAPQYVANVLNVAYTLRTADPFTKAQTLAGLAQQFGVDLKLLAPSQDGQPQNPELAALKQQYSELHQNFTRQQQEQQRAQQEAARQEQERIQQSIQTFASDPANRYFNDVAPVMGALIQSGQAATMKEAYEMAVHARPDIRAQLQAEENAKRESDRLAAQKAEEAKRKGKSVRGGPGGSMPAPVNPNASVREDLEAAFAEARGRI